MLLKKNHWIILLTIPIAVLTFWALTLPTEVHAARQYSATTANNSCLSCHEDLYYLHDTGCWYCMSEAHKDRCVDCHEGNASAVKEEDAHIGLLMHPQENDGAKCLECHTADDAQIRLSKFESIQGFNTVIHEEPYTPSHPVKTGFPDVTEANTLHEKLGWLVFSFLAFGAWLLLVLKR